MIPTFVQNVRKFPFFGNFVAFPIRDVLEHSFNIVRGGMRKLQSDNPYIRQIGARQLILDNNCWNCNTCSNGYSAKYDWYYKRNV